MVKRSRGPASTINEITAIQMATQAGINPKAFRQALRKADLSWYVRYGRWKAPRDSPKHAEMQRILEGLRSN